MTTILTIRMDPLSQAWFDDLRQKHFPPELNQIAAHLTLFHKLPGTDAARWAIEQISAQTPPFPMHITGLQSLGRGVAYKLAAPQLSAVHASLAAAFRDDLSSQDKQGFRPHVVVQNKTSTKAARTLLDTLDPGYQRFIERKLREEFGFEGSPIEVVVKPRKQLGPGGRGKAHG